MESQKNQSVSSPQLKAGRAFALFFLFITLQTLTGIIVGFATGIFAALQGANMQDLQVVAQVNQQAMLFATISGFLLASLTAMYLSMRWFPKEINEKSMTGAAWRVGSPSSLLLGIGGGVFIAFSYLLLLPAHVVLRITY